MTIEEAITESRKGVKITHQYFTSDEWMIVDRNKITFEDGVTLSIDEFLSTRSTDDWKTDWEIFED